MFSTTKVGLQIIKNYIQIYEKFIKVKKVEKPKPEVEPKKLIDNTTTLITFD